MITIWPSKFHPQVYNQEKWKHVQSKMCMNVHSSIIYNNQKVETTQMNINWWIYK